jgi:hypothetical protein
MQPSPDGELEILRVVALVLDVSLYDSPITTGADGSDIVTI